MTKQHFRVVAAFAGFMLVTGISVAPTLAKSRLLFVSSNVKTEQLLAQQALAPTPTHLSSPINGGDSVGLEVPVNELTLQRLVNQDAVEVPLSQSEIQRAEEEFNNPALVRRDTLRERALRIAKTQLGKGEVPPESNCQPYSRYFRRGCEAWCADFVSWAVDRAGNRNKLVPWGNPASVPGILNWGRRRGKIVRRPIPGDIFIIQGGGQSHTGFVKTVERLTFTSIEGNASNMVRSNRRLLRTPNLTFIRFDRDR